MDDMDDTQEEYMLTTVDNPFNPFINFDEWNAWDRAAGYHTTEFLARVVNSSDDLSEADQHTAIEIAMAEILKENVSGMHRKITANGIVAVSSL